MLCNSTAIPKVSLTRSLIPRVAVVHIETESLSVLCISHMKGVSEKFKRIGNKYYIRPIYRTTNTLRNSLMRTRPERDSQQTAQ
jgi:hypothetical protein